MLFEFILTSSYTFSGPFLKQLYLSHGLPMGDSLFPGSPQDPAFPSHLQAQIHPGLYVEPLTSRTLTLSLRSGFRLGLQTSQSAHWSLSWKQPLVSVQSGSLGSREIGGPVHWDMLSIVLSALDPRPCSCTLVWETLNGLRFSIVPCEVFLRSWQAFSSVLPCASEFGSV